MNNQTSEYQTAYEEMAAITLNVDPHKANQAPHNSHESTAKLSSWACLHGRDMMELIRAGIST